MRQEPLRLSRRYVTTNASFMVMLAREVIRDRAAGRPLGITPGTATAADALAAQPQMVYLTPGEGP